MVVLLILLLLISGLAIYASNMPASPSFYINELSFKLGEDGRNIELYVKVIRGNVELKQFFVNDDAVNSWTADKHIIREGESSKCLLKYPWKMGNYYTIKVITTDDQSMELTAKAPEVFPSLKLEITQVNVTICFETLKVNVTYSAYSNGTDSMHMLLFTYLSFEWPSRPIYIFYDPRYMTDESLKRAEIIINHFKDHNIIIERADYTTLEKLSKDMPRVILILINPLKDYMGKRIENAAPAPLVDPNGNGLLKDDSKYGKSHLYDWMRDKGLILITVGSLQPYKRILYSEGTYSRAKDSYKPLDAHIFLTDASGEKSIINGSFVLGDYTPVRISSTLGLAYREATFGFDKDSMEEYGIHYYAYGDYKLPYADSYLNLTLPVFIQVGDGGWLAMGDGEYWLEDKELAHDLLMIYLQSIWDSTWVPYGWYWDNGAAFYSNYQATSYAGCIETECIPSKIVENELVIRVMGIAYSSDLCKSIISQQIISYQKPQP
jgi:hypothetical protein